MGMWRKLSNLFRRNRLAAEIDEELQAHLALAAEARVNAGMNETEDRTS